MSLRYIGAILIFISCGAVGFIMAANYRREERCLSRMVQILDHMQCELEYRLTPLPQLCTLVSQQETGCLHKVFASLVQELESQIAPDVATCMQAALSGIKDIPTATRQTLTALGSCLGKYDLSGQINEIKSVKQNAQSILDKIRSHQDLRLRSYQTLGLCIGAGLAILLL